MKAEELALAALQALRARITLSDADARVMDGVISVFSATVSDAAARREKATRKKQSQRSKDKLSLFRPGDVTRDGPGDNGGDNSGDGPGDTGREGSDPSEVTKENSSPSSKASPDLKEKTDPKREDKTPQTRAGTSPGPNQGHDGGQNGGQARGRAEGQGGDVHVLRITHKRIEEIFSAKRKEAGFGSYRLQHSDFDRTVKVVDWVYGEHPEDQGAAIALSIDHFFRFAEDREGAVGGYQYWAWARDPGRWHACTGRERDPAPAESFDENQNPEWMR